MCGGGWRPWKPGVPGGSGDSLDLSEEGRRARRWPRPQAASPWPLREGAAEAQAEVRPQDPPLLAPPGDGLTDVCPKRRTDHPEERVAKGKKEACALGMPLMKGRGHWPRASDGQ